MPEPRDTQRSKVYTAEQKAFPAFFTPEWTEDKEGWEQAMRILHKRGVVERAYPEAFWALTAQYQTTEPYQQHRPGKTGYGTRQGLIIGRWPGSTRAMSWDRIRWITLPTWARNRYVLCHELAHQIVDRSWRDDDRIETKPAAHGWYFCEVYYHLIRTEFGKDEERRLKEKFRETGARYNPPRRTRPLTEEQKQVLRDRLAQARSEKD